MASIKDTGRLRFPFPTLDPYLYLAWHVDVYPPGDEEMQAPVRGNGADFDHSAPFRMYHGEKYPGFPQHPHRGFETITCLMDGINDHSDSKGNIGRYGFGDVQWMTAGRGILHGENFPLLNRDAPNRCEAFQIWLNLPAARKMCEPTYRMHWAENIKKIEQADGSKVIVIAGEFGAQAKSDQAPPPDSWAADANNDVAVWHVSVPAGARVVLPPAKIGAAANRRIYIVERQGLRVDDRGVEGEQYVTLRAELPTTLVNDGAAPTALLLLQGRPIGEPVVARGPFVMNTNQEILQAYQDFQRTQFGGWPYDSDVVIHPRDKGRFSIQNGVEERPPARH